MIVTTKQRQMIDCIRQLRQFSFVKHKQLNRIQYSRIRFESNIRLDFDYDAFIRTSICEIVFIKETKES